METVKVDIRKLQLLNDRINQCIDALNQVRLSAHGLSHTGLPGVAAGTYPQVGAFPMAQVPGIGINPYAQIPGAAGFIPGISHTTAPQAFGQGIIPGLTPQFIPGLTPQFVPPFVPGPFVGLAHTSADPYDWYPRPLWADPLLASRLIQTFPYAQVPVPPVMSII